jgi:hypothetical protein
MWAGNCLSEGRGLFVGKVIEASPGCSVGVRPERVRHETRDASPFNGGQGESRLQGNEL